MVRRFSTAFTVPEQDEMTLAETKPSAAPMIWPTSTGSPFLTMALAGLPMCCARGKTISPLASNLRSDASLLSSLRSLGCTPPRKVSLTFDPSFCDEYGFARHGAKKQTSKSKLFIRIPKPTGFVNKNNGIPRKNFRFSFLLPTGVV